MKRRQLLWGAPWKLILEPFLVVPGVSSCRLLRVDLRFRLEVSHSGSLPGGPTFWRLWATLEEEQLSWATH